MSATLVSNALTTFQDLAGTSLPVFSQLNIDGVIDSDRYVLEEIETPAGRKLPCFRRMGTGGKQPVRVVPFDAVSAFEIGGEASGMSVAGSSVSQVPSTTGPAAGAAAPETPAPIARRGYQTTEFWVTTVTAFVVALFGLLTAFGLNLTSQEKTTILEIIAPTIALVSAIYVLSRSYVKGKA